MLVLLNKTKSKCYFSMAGAGDNDDYILKLLDESVRSSEGNINYDSDAVLEVFDDNTDEDPDYVLSEVDEVSSDDEINNPGPSTSKRGRPTLFSSTPRKRRPKPNQDTRPQHVFHDLSDISNSDSNEDPPPQPANVGSNWKPLDVIFNVYPYNPNDEPVGINPDLIETMAECEPIDFFNLYFDIEVVGLLVEETNRYAQQTLQSIPHSPHGRLGKWTDCDANEMRRFFGIVIYMGLNVLPTIAHYWRNDELYRSVVSKVMSRNRFELILRVLHCANNEEHIPGNRLYKIEKLVSLLNEKFKTVAIPQEKICIDESVVPFLGRLIFRQYLKNKRHRYGIKIFKLCAEGGYCLTYKIYSGKEQDQRATNLSAKVVLELVEPYLDFGRTVYTDNWYTSVPLAETLGERSTHLVGTLNRKRKDNPKEVMNAKLKKGEVVALKNDKNVVVLKWKDKRDVQMLTTKHGTECQMINVRGGNQKSKPEAVIDYNTAKAFIDYGDQMAAYSSPLRRSVKWYRKILFDIILSTSVINSLYIYKIVTGKNTKIAEYKENLAIEMFKKIDIMPQEVVVHQEHKLERQPKRSKCTKCYTNLAKTRGRKEAQAKTKKVYTKCLDCNMYLCSECFFSHHKVSGKR